MPARAAYNRFDVATGGTGTAVVIALARDVLPATASGFPGVARVRIGVLGRGADKQPAIVRETASDTVYVPDCAVAPGRAPHPKGRGASRSTIETFVPAEVDPGGSGGERRALGARVCFA